MDNTKPFTIEEDDQWYLPDDERSYDWAVPADENGVPFSVPRD